MCGGHSNVYGRWNMMNFVLRKIYPVVASHCSLSYNRNATLDK